MALRILAIDIGCTSTGYAYPARELDFGKTHPDHINPLLNMRNSWPDAPSASGRDPKTRSAMLYSRTTRRLVSWGNTAVQTADDAWSDDYVLVRNVRSLLESPTSELAMYVAREIGKNPEEVMAEFVRRIVETAVEEMAVTEGRATGIPELKFVFTVPSTWPPAICKSLRMAMYLAALAPHPDHPSIQLCQEADAFLCMAAYTNQTLADGNVVVLADCGGQTTSVSAYLTKVVPPQSDKQYPSYEFTALGTPQLLALGADTLDAGYLQYLRTQFGDLPPASIAGIVGAWRRARDGYSVSSSGNHLELEVPRQAWKQLPAAAAAAIGAYNARVASASGDDDFDEDDAVVLVPHAEVRRILDGSLVPIGNAVLAALNSARNSMPDPPTGVKVVCVGGMGGNAYVRARVEDAVRGSVGAALTAGMVIADPRGAAARGAVIQGLHKSSLTARLAPMWVGVAAHLPYNPSVHGAAMSPDHLITDPVSGAPYIRAGFDVLVSKRQQLRLGHTLETAGYAAPPSSANGDPESVVLVAVYGSVAGSPADSSRPPLRVADAGVVPIGVVRVPAATVAAGGGRFAVHLEIGLARIDCRVVGESGAPLEQGWVW